MHRQTADGPREALWHILHPTDGPVLKTSGNERRLIDAGSAIFAREPVGAVSELPVKDVIETIHGGDPYAAPQEDRDRRVVHLSISRTHQLFAALARPTMPNGYQCP